jgi:hypothetical protein
MPLTTRSKFIIPLLFDFLFPEGDSRRSRGTTIISGWLTRLRSQGAESRRPKETQGLRLTVQMTLMVRMLMIAILLGFGRPGSDDDDCDDEYEQRLLGMRGGCIVKLKGRDTLVELLSRQSARFASYLLPFCMWTPRILPKGPASSIALWSVVAKRTLHWIAIVSYVEGGGAHKGYAGKNAEFLHIIEPNERWSELPPGRQGTVIPTLKTDKSILVTVSQLTLSRLA